MKWSAGLYKNQNQSKCKHRWRYPDFAKTRYEKDLHLRCDLCGKLKYKIVYCYYIKENK